ncbi:MAG: DUF1501 domain-containing protein [Acidobacteria bacterium]|nr:DUF1501 domain-containing protein [Acidobacteriota bacterium]MBI3280580.1 DUF1501 domain-containing protein [Acidobacteriota bacterium]
MKDRFGIDWSQIKGSLFWQQPELSRRLFFRHVASAVSGYFLLPTRPLETVARAAGKPLGVAKSVIFVYLNGGPSHTDMFDLKTGPWTPEFENPSDYNGVMFPQGLMPTIAEHLDSIALLRSVRSWAAVHDLARIWIQIARNPTSALSRIAPHVGSVVSLELAAKNLPLPAFVSLNTGNSPRAGYLDPRHAPFYVSPRGDGLPNTLHPDGTAAFDRRYELLQNLDTETRESGLYGPAFNEMAAFNAGGRQLMYNDDIDRVFRFGGDEKNRYGGTTNDVGTPFGNACITARNLLRANLGTRFIQISLGGWDQHAAIYNPTGGIRTLSRQFDLGLGSLLADLKEEGLLDQTLVFAMGEFGRTVGPINSQGGRDHFLQQSVLMAGARIKGPKVIGNTDEFGRNTVEPGWGRDRDIRPEDIAATVYSALGIDWTTIRRDDPLGRGFEYVPFADRDLYGPVHEIWS